MKKHKRFGRLILFFIAFFFLVGCFDISPIKKVKAEILLEVQVRVVLIILVKSILSLVVHLVKRKKAKETAITLQQISLISLHQGVIQVLIK
ncbi:MAG: hypothetical protein E7J22_11205 [Clostridium perfringens]|nr:hypothetical protein [Clostridium perfringens]